MPTPHQPHDLAAMIDEGYLIENLVYGVGGGASVLGEDFAPVRQVVSEARVLVHTIMSLLG